MTRVFRNHIAKINWANHHLDTLDHSVTAWFDGNKHFTHSIVPDPDDSSSSVLMVSADDIPIIPCSLVIGDIVHNIRSSLDHIVYELALAYTNPFPEEFKIKSQFPLLGDENKSGIGGKGFEMFRDNALPSMIKCIHPDAQKFIESIQPYKRGSGFRDDPLWQLNYMSNADKHRILHISAAYAASYTVTACRIFGGDFTSVPCIVKNNMIVAKLGIVRPIDPTKTIDMQIIPSMTIAFSEGLLLNKLVHDTLLSLSNYVGTKVLVPLGKFL